MVRSAELRDAKKNKNDEFYTQLTDIEKEMRYYKEHFEGKVVLCNCDDPYESNFFKYFALNFNRLKLKKLISISYANSPVAGEELKLFEELGEEKYITGRKAYKVVMSELKDVTGDGREDLLDVKEIVKHRIRYLKGDGDFRSDESIELLKEADIVCTNPPFSLFRDFIGQLMNYDKKFIIIGNINAITYKETFPLIQENKMWMGASIHSGDREFRVPDSYPLKAAGSRIDENGKKYIRVKGVRWFTNLDYKERHEDLDLYKEYSSEEYPEYDNYNAVEVSKTSDIPIDYDGIMGVPITFLDKYNPEQFEIVGLDRYTVPKEFLVGGRVAINGKPKYARILIRRKKADKHED